jgi:hypothetical protein
VKLRYTLRAAAELDEVLAYIVALSPQGARRVQARIQLIIELLLQHPRAGQNLTNWIKGWSPASGFFCSTSRSDATNSPRIPIASLPLPNANGPT